MGAYFSFSIFFSKKIPIDDEVSGQMNFIQSRVSLFYYINANQETPVVGLKSANLASFLKRASEEILGN